MFHYVQKVVKKERFVFDSKLDPLQVFSNDETIVIEETNNENNNQTSLKRKVDEEQQTIEQTKKQKQFEKSFSLSSISLESLLKVKKQNDVNNKALFYKEDDQVYEKKKRLKKQNFEERSQEIFDNLSKCSMKSELVYLVKLKSHFEHLFSDFQSELNQWQNNLDSIAKRL